MSAWWRWKHSSWSPVNCPQRFATEYNFKCDESSEKSELSASDTSTRKIPFPQHRKKTSTKLATSIRYKIQTCGACMKPLLEPYKLPCGHIFCKRCLTNLCLVLADEYSDVITDHRAVMRCPLGTCRNRKLCLSCPGLIRCMPFVNGDFRFTKVRQEHKVQLEVDDEDDEDEEFTDDEEGQ